MKKSTFNIMKYSLLLMPLALVGCGGDDDDDQVTQTYEVSVTNLTNNQPLSPTGVVLHNSSYTPWNSGSAATIGLETLAESGDNTAWLAQASTGLTSGSTTGVTAPGAQAAVTLTVNQTSELYLTTASMLVNTNDAFTGVRQIDLSDLTVGDTLSLTARVYDAGTEANTETAASIPGPAGGGEGFNAAQETNGTIRVHQGVVTADDGLTTSALNESHRFDQSTQRIQVTRTQ